MESSLDRNSSSAPSQAVDMLKKISLTYTAGTESDSRDLVRTPQKLEFVFGVGSEGLTGFEYALAGKAAGEAGQVEVGSGMFGEFFGHLLAAHEVFPAAGIQPGRFFLQYEIDGISDTTPREIVKSMAGAVGGCEGGCGCGCGSH